MSPDIAANLRFSLGEDDPLPNARDVSFWHGFRVTRTIPVGIKEAEYMPTFLL